MFELACFCAEWFVVVFHRWTCTI